MTPRTLGFTAGALVCFAANSLLCRLALRDTAIDAASFTTLRVGAGALMLLALLALGKERRGPGGDWGSAFALFAYAILFSLAYLALPAGAGALLLFGAVQLTMFAAAFARGERLAPRQSLGALAAAVGVVWLLLPGASAPPLGPALLMLGAGVAWGAYSLRGRRSTAPLADTAGNFLRAVPWALAASVLAATLGTSAGGSPSPNWDVRGVVYAVASGAFASGVGYAIWYAALRGLAATQAATVQLAVPVLAALGGVALLGERFTARLALAAALVLGGLALVVRPVTPPARP